MKNIRVFSLKNTLTAGAPSQSTERPRCVMCGRCRLFHHQEVVVFLAFLDEDILAVQKHVGGDGRIYVGHFFFVDRQAAVLGQLTHFALRGEDGRFVGQEVGDFQLAVNVGAADFKRRHALELVEKGLFVVGAEAFVGVLAE